MSDASRWLARLAASGVWASALVIACGADSTQDGGPGTGGSGGSAALSPAGGAPGGAGKGGATSGKGGSSGGSLGGTSGGSLGATGGSSSGSGGVSGGGLGATGGTSGAATGGTSGVVGGASGAAAGGTSGGVGGTTGGTAGAAAGGTNGGVGGTTGGAAGTASGGTNGGVGGATAGSSGTTSGGAGGATGGKGGSGTAGTGGAPATGPCTVGAWPTADPTKAGPYATTTESNIGPSSSDGTRFTLVRPTNLGETALCHPIVTWGNGSGSQVTFYTKLLKQLASHGFIVIASQSGNVQQGNPYFQIAGAQWVVEQNAVSSSPLYQRVDTTHVGATGHSLGGYATSEVGRNSLITTTAPACGAIGSNQMKGPSLILCGGNDQFVPCDDDPLAAFNGTSGVPVMVANSHGADHGNWFGGQNLSDMEMAITAWMRVQLMGDTALRNWFYGASCLLCQDSDWTVQKKMMD